MQSDDEIQTTLSKWPFIIGDILLVATALSIGILSDWQLTNWQVATCVVSVALGAAIFILPYIVEFQVRVREEREDRSADLRILQKRFISTQDQLELVGDRLQTLEANLVHLSQDKPEDEVIDSLRSDLAALHVKVASLPAAPVKDPTLEESPKAETQPKVKKPKEAPKNPKSEPEIVKPAVVVEADKEEPIDEPVEVVETTKEEPVDAVPDEKMDEPKAKPAAKKKTAKKTAKKATKKAAKKDEPELVPVEDSDKQEVESVEKDIPEEVVVEDLIVVPLEEEEADAEPLASEPEIVVEPKIEDKPQEEVQEKEEVDDSSEPEGEDMFEEAVPEQAEKRVPTKKSDTAVIASVFIGIGNKPYLRGSGAGLNWESGVAMEFEEIGKWRWIAPSEQEGPIELQIYRNDEDPDSTGKYTLEPGQQLDISPVF